MVDITKNKLYCAINLGTFIRRKDVIYLLHYYLCYDNKRRVSDTKTVRRVKRTQWALEIETNYSLNKQ